MLLLPIRKQLLKLYVCVQSGKVSNPQPLKSGWSQVVRQKSRGTVSAPASPSKKQQASLAGNTRRDLPGQSWNKRPDLESVDRANPSNSGDKQRDSRRSGNIAANTGRAIPHVGTAEPRDLGDLPIDVMQSASKRDMRSQDTSDAAASSSTSMVRTKSFPTDEINERSLELAIGKASILNMRSYFVLLSCHLSESFDNAG